MKTFFALAALAMIQASGAAVAAQQTTGDIKSEFLRWKASEAGKQAYKNNLVPARRSSTSRMSLMDADEPTEDELTRFQNSIDAVARIQEQQPQATFSINTPFALMTKDEFQAYVAKSKVQEHLKEVEKRLNPPMPVAESATAAATSLNASSAVAAAATATGISAGAGSLSAGLESTSTVGVTANSTSTSTSTTITVMNNGTRRLDTWVVDVDWQTKGCVTRIKNQGACGVCWAFAATGALESAYCAKTGKLYELSEQEVVSCSRDKASCDGGFAGYTYDWLTRLNGGSICTEKSYPFVSGEGNAPSCKLYDGASAKCEKPNLGAYFYDGGFFPDHKQLEAAVLKQPVAMSIAAYGDAFQYYTGGVLMGDEKNCPVDKINHEIILVGFGTLNGVPYWKVKNQWSEAWGDHGYMYIERGYQGHEFGACGVEKYGFYPKFPATSDPGLSKRTTTPRWGYAISGQQLRVLLGIWEPEQCASRCTQDASCVGYNWFPNPLYWCELKSTNTGLVSASTSSGSVISKAESLSKCAPITNNADFPGNDLRATIAATAEDCCDHCDAVKACNAFTWSKYNGGMCYLKTQGPAKPVAASPDSDGSAYLRSGVKYKCQPLQTNTDRPGNDLSSAPSSTAANCCGICRATKDCYGFSWTDYNGGTCWLKAFGSSSTYAAGVTSAMIY